MDVVYIVLGIVMFAILLLMIEGIGGRVQMGTVQERGVELIEPADLRGLHDTVDLWESQCAELLLGTDEPPSASDTVDGGVRPPD